MEAFNFYILNELKRENILELIEKYSIISITDRYGRIEYVSDCYCNVLECEPNQLIGESHKLIRSHLHTGIVYKNLWNTIKSGQKWHGVLNDVSKKGNPFWLDTTIIPLKSKKTVKYLAVYNDVTKLQLEKQKLLKQNKANKNLLDHMPFNMFEVSRFGKILNANKDFESYKVNELIDNYFFDFIHPEWHEDFKDCIEAVFKLKVPHQFEKVLLISEMEKVTYNILVSPIFDNIGQIASALITLQDVTDVVIKNTINSEYRVFK